MAVAGAAKRYAQAAFDLAKSQNAVERWEQDLQHLLAVMRNPKVIEFFDNPSVPEDAKRQAIATILPAPEQRYVRNLANLLLERRRLSQLPDVVEHFRALALEDRGVAIADVSTAVELTPEETTRLVDQLNTLLGREVLLRTHVDPEIIGGIVVRVGDMLIDGSVRTQLQALRRQMAR